VGNLILAVVAAVPSYFLAHRFAVRYRRGRVPDPVEGALEEVIEVTER